MKQNFFMVFLTFIIFSSSSFSSDFQKEGISCIKVSGSIETKTYLGLVQIDGTTYTGIRTERLAKSGKQFTDLGGTLVLDDGKSTEPYYWNDNSVVALPIKSGSAFPPADISLNIMMGKRLFGKCESWTVDINKLQRPKVNSGN